MAKRPVVPQKSAAQPKRTKAEEAVSRTPRELHALERDSLIVRLIVGMLLLFGALFLILSMFGVHAVVLDLLRGFFQGLLGYGFWLAPLALLYIAWMLVFLHEEPIRGRIVSTVLLTVCISALIHAIFCDIDFSGLSMVKNLWITGTEGASGGVIPGLIAELLLSMISKGGTIPVLVVCILVLVFLMLRLSAAKLIHTRAEKRREVIREMEAEQPPAPEPVQYDTRADLRVLATPVVRQRMQAERVKKQQDFDLQLGPETATKRRPSGTKKQRMAEPRSEGSAFDISMEKDYTAQVQELVRQEQMMQPEEDDFSWMMERRQPERTASRVPVRKAEPETAAEPEEMGFVPEIEETVPDVETLEVVKEQKLSHSEAEEAAREMEQEIEARADAEALEKPVYQYPPMSMLAEAMGSKEDNTEEMRYNVRRLEETLMSFGVDIQISNVVRGPAVTRYEMELKPGVKMNKITSLHEDIALSLGVTSVHVAAVPGKSSTIGIEVPNSIVTSVPIKEVLESKEFQHHKSALAFAAGKDISGNYIIGDIAKMPHLLIAGTTGSGKSVCMNSIIVSLLYRDSPDQCRLIMIDPKVVELSIYNGVPHLLIPVVTDPKKAAGALQWAVTEMDRRYNRFENARVRDLAGYNKKALSDEELEPMPRIVIIIDELADLMMVAAKEVETSIARLAAKARAAGMHLVIATQRPSADVITGVIKANIPSRIAFAVSSAMESNIIMGTRGAEKLLGKGDMFYAPQGSDKPKRVQGCFISDEEVERVAEFVKEASETDYSDEIMSEIEQNATASAGKSDFDDDQMALDGDGDPMLPDAVEVVLDTKQASVSMLQRRLKLGYAHAARIMDEMEEKGIVGPFEGSKPRQLLIDREQWANMVGVNPKAVAAEPEPEDVPFDEDE